MIKFKKIILSLGAILISLVIVYFQFPGLVIDATTRISRSSAGTVKHEIKTGNHNWAYLKGGEGETVLLIHGFGLNKDLWGEILPALTKSYKVIAPDMPGFGETEPVNGEHYTVKKQTERLHQFITELKLESFHIIGVSMGGAIAAIYASQHPGKVKSIIMIGPFGVDTKTKSDFRKIYEKGQNPLAFKTAEEYDVTVSYGVNKPGKVPVHFKSYVAGESAKRYDFNISAFKDEIDSEGWDMLRPYLKKIDSPALVIFGDKDRIIDVSGIEIYRSELKNVKTEIIKDAGHLAYLDKPFELIKVVKEFIPDNKARNVKENAANKKNKKNENLLLPK